MHIVTLTKPVTDPRWNLAVGSYLAEDLSAFELATSAERGSAFVQPFGRTPGWTINLNGAPRRLLWIHNGGYGDMLMAVPALRAFAGKFPDVELTISCRKRVHCVFDGLPFGPKLIDYPVLLEVADSFNRIICSEHIQESSERGKTTPAMDLKAELLGVGPLAGEQRKTIYTVSDQEFDLAEEKYPRNHRKRVGIQIKSSSPTRDLHTQRMGEILTRLYDKGHEIFLFGTVGTLPANPFPDSKRDLIKDITAHALSFRESVAAATTCDVILCPDSSFLHVCGALEIPCVAIFGSTSWKLRSADYKSVTALQGHGPCSPCWHHPKGAEIFPRGEMCEKMGYCGPMHMIQADQIVAAIEKKLK
jgi:ADP-heptose:LPS heptosyltransferase